MIHQFRRDVYVWLNAKVDVTWEDAANGMLISEPGSLRHQAFELKQAWGNLVYAIARAIAVPPVDRNDKWEV